MSIDDMLAVPGSKRTGRRADRSAPGKVTRAEELRQQLADDIVRGVLAPGASLDEKAISAFARETLTPYKVPRRYVVVDALPKSIIGKVLRRKLRDELLASAERS